jgi:membrane protein DedA with SNARE-associated domain
MESFLHEWGYAALILFGFLEAACIPISSEITFGFAGVLAYEGHLNLLLVIILGTLAELAGSYASYAVGRIGGRPLVHKLGRYVLVTESDVDRAERFLEGRGMWAIPVGRMLPFVRAFTSIVAGLVRIPALKFGILSLIGTVLYAAALSSIGYALGSTWQSVSHGLAVVGYVLFALIVLAIVGFVAYRWRAFRREAQLKRATAPPATTSAATAAAATAPAATTPAGAASAAAPAGTSGGPGQPAAPGTSDVPRSSDVPGGGDRPRPHSHRAR